MKRYALVIALTGLGAACGGSPTGPSASPDGFLTGSWSGTLTVSLNGLPAVSGSTVWRFESVAQTAGSTYRVSIESQNAVLAMSTTGSAALTPPGTPPAQISTQGDYRSPRGCLGSFGSFGVVDAHHLTATFQGVDCGQTFDGTVELSR